MRGTIEGPLGLEAPCWRCGVVYQESTLKVVYQRGYTTDPKTARTWAQLGKVCEPCLAGDVEIMATRRRVPGEVVSKVEWK